MSRYHHQIGSRAIHLRPFEKLMVALTFILFFTLIANAQTPLKPVALTVEEQSALKLAQKDLEILELRKKLLETEIQNSLLTALRRAGVKDSDFPNYTFNPETFLFTPKEAPKDPKK